MTDSTINYYNKNSQSFFDRTISADMDSMYRLFIDHLCNDAHILDLGCGSGRDAKYFQDQGFKVLACDASKELAKLASNYLGEDVLCLKFAELDFDNKFDGVWANASLLHVPYTQLQDILQRIHKSLKKDGVFYASFKHGDGHRVAEERHFYDMNQEIMQPYFEPLFTIIKTVVSKDTRSQVAASPLKQWFNVIARKA